MTLQPAVLIGRAAFGPSCAKKAGLVKPKTRRPTDTVQRDERTQDLFEGEK